MLISCKCLNFIATSNKNQQHHSNNNQQLQQQKSLPTGSAALSASTTTTPLSADAPVSPFKPQQQQPLRAQLYTAVGNECNNNNNNNNSGNGNGCMVSAELMHAFLQKYPRNFVFYSQCMDFFKEAIGPIPNLTINAVNQRDLIYSLTLEVQQQSWQISVCINCNVALCAKRLPAAPTSPNGSSSSISAAHQNPPVYFINGALQTSNEELTHRRAERSFSDTFGLLIMDHSMNDVMHSGNVTPTSLNGSNNMSTASTVFSIGSLNTMVSSPSFGTTDPKQQRLRQLQHNLQQRLQREIAETDERIQRYSEQQFALLRSFREKSEQEFELLTRLIQRVPEQAIMSSNANGSGGLDRAPPSLDVSEGVSYVARRRNTITSRRDLNNVTTVAAGTGTTTISNVGAPTTPTSPYAPMNFIQVTTTSSITTSSSSMMSLSSAAVANNSSAMETTKITTNNNNTQNNNNNNVNNNNNGGATTASSASVTVIKANNNNRRMSNFDTPPATPEAMPMSVGSSPTFQQETTSNVQMKHQQLTKQQQQQQQQNLQKKGENIKLMTLPLQARFGVQQQQQQQQQQQSFQQQYTIPNNNDDNDDDDDVDCLFELDGEDMSNYNLNNNNYNNSTTITPQSPVYQQQSHQLYQRSMSIVSNQQDNTMSDLDESDGAEEAEDAIDLDSSQPIPMQTESRFSMTSAERLNFGKSLPIDIAGSPMVERNNYINTITHEEDLDCTLDIAASIKALAKSVHGEAVFGDLPRPRLRSQI